MINAMRVWAMRTSRDSETHRSYVQKELLKGCLRQGWGYLPEQDLRRVRRRVEDPTVGWSNLSEDEQWAWGHWRLLGEAAENPDDAMLVGDIVLVPNMPSDGMFTLCRLTGDYDYDIDPLLGDLGNLRPVKVLTPDGVAYEHPVVTADLRRSLRCRSRLWWIGGHAECVAEILEMIETGKGAKLRNAMDHTLRAQNKVAEEIRASLHGLAKAIEAPLKATLQSAEWEPVLQAALIPLLRDVQVIHTGGPSEKGADIEIHVPNPFNPAEPWIIAVQVKDYVGEIDLEVVPQLEQAITARIGIGYPGRLVAVVLASTEASPSDGLSDEMEKLSKKYGLSVSCVHGDELMRVLARGLFIGFREAAKSMT